MFKIEEDLMFLTHLVCPVVDRVAVGSCGLHHVDHHSEDIYFVTSRKGLPFSCFVFYVSLDSYIVLILLLIKEGGESVLSSELFPRLFR